MKKLLYFIYTTIFLTSIIHCTEVSYRSIKRSPTGGEFPEYDTDLKIGYRTCEYVVNFSGSSQDRDKMLRYLTDTLKLKHKKTCPCSDSLQLWEGKAILSPDGDNPDKPVKGSGNDTNVVRNFIVFDQFDKPTIFLGLQEGSPQPIGQPDAPTLNSNALLAIVDSGIDEKLTQESNQISYLVDNRLNVESKGKTRLLPYICGSSYLQGRFGANILRFRKSKPKVTPNSPLISSIPSKDNEPFDKDGHGTFIHGIIAGIARIELPQELQGNCNRNYNIGGNEGVNLKILHVKFAENRKEDGSLYDALCGIHYALEKEAKIINASWRVRVQPRFDVRVKNTYL